MKPFLVILFLVASLTGWIQQRSIVSVRKSIDAQRELAAKANGLLKPEEDLPKTEVNPEEIVAWKAEKSELMRLRAEITELRKVAKITPETMQAEIGRLHQEAATERERAQMIVATEEARICSEAARSLLSTFNGLVVDISRKTGLTLPASLDEIATAASSQEETKRRWDWAMGWMNKPLAPGVSLENIEFVKTSALATPSSTQRRLLMRERTPRKIPAGGLARAYAFSDGEVEEVRVSDAGGFETWERKHP